MYDLAFVLSLGSLVYILFFALKRRQMYTRYTHHQKDISYRTIIRVSKIISIVVCIILICILVLVYTYVFMENTKTHGYQWFVLNLVIRNAKLSNQNHIIWHYPYSTYTYKSYLIGLEENFEICQLEDTFSKSLNKFALHTTIA